MTTLRERFNNLLKPECVAGEFTLYQAAQLVHVARKMDALLEECERIFDRHPYLIQGMAPLHEKLKKEGYGK